MADGNVAGILRRNDLVQALAQGRRETRVGDVMSRDCGAVPVSDALDKTLERMSREGCATLAVMDGGNLAGLLTLENIGELVMVKAAVAKGAGQDSGKN